jgi:hypothetical protein
MILLALKVADWPIKLIVSLVVSESSKALF